MNIVLADGENEESGDADTPENPSACELWASSSSQDEDLASPPEDAVDGDESHNQESVEEEVEEDMDQGVDREVDRDGDDEAEGSSPGEEEEEEEDENEGLAEMGLPCLRSSATLTAMDKHWVSTRSLLTLWLGEDQAAKSATKAYLSTLLHSAESFRVWTMYSTFHIHLKILRNHKLYRISLSFRGRCHGWKMILWAVMLYTITNGTERTRLRQEMDRWIDQGGGGTLWKLFSENCRTLRFSSRIETEVSSCVGVKNIPKQKTLNLRIST